MPTILSHPAVPLAIGFGLGARAIPPRLLAAGVVASMLPDIDVVGFAYHVPYGSALGHRGFAHSPAFAAVIALLAAAAARAFAVDRLKAFWFIFIATASHGLLDAFTNGGLGVAFLWPLSDARMFAPVRVIEVSPIGLTRLLSGRGLTVLYSESLWVWAPCVLLGATLARLRALTAPRE